MRSLIALALLIPTITFAQPANPPSLQRVLTAGNTATVDINIPTADLISDQQALCGSAISSQSYVNGVCSSDTARQVLNFDITKTGTNGIVGAVVATAENNSTSTGPNLSGATFTIENNAPTSGAITGTGTYRGLYVLWSQLQDLSAGTHNIRGLDITQSTTPTSAAGATVRQYGLHVREINAYTGATSTVASAVFENDVYLESNDRLFFESNGGVAPSAGDTHISFDSTDTDVELVVDNVQVADFDNDVIDLNVPITVSAGSTGTVVHQVDSVATNDDPTEEVIQGRVATTNDAKTTMIAYTLATSRTVLIDCSVTARRTGGAAGTAGDSAGYRTAATFVNDAGTIKQVGTQTYTAAHESQAIWDAVITTTGSTTVDIQVSGAVNNNVSWHTTCRFWAVGT